MSLPLGDYFYPHGGFSSPSTLILHLWGRVTRAQKFTVTCVTSVTLLGMPDPRPDIRCVQYYTKVQYKVPDGFEHQIKPLKSGTDNRDLKHHWISNRYPKPSGRCQKWIQSINKCQDGSKTSHGVKEDLLNLLQMYIHEGEL